MNVLDEQRIVKAARARKYSVQNHAVGLAREFGMTPSQIANMSDDRILHVHGMPNETQKLDGEVSWACTSGACFFLAQRAVEAALERGCGKIIIYQGVHKHPFDTYEVGMRAKARSLTGHIKRPTFRGLRRPPHYGQAKQLAAGGEFDFTRPLFHVGTTLSSEDAGSQGGTQNGK